MASANLGLGSSNPFLQDQNPYLQQMIEQTGGDLTKAWNTTALPAFNAAMMRSGSFGNAGVNEATALGADQLQGNIADAAGRMRFADYNQRAGMYMQQQGFDEGQRQFDQNLGRATFNDAYSQNMGNLGATLQLLNLYGGANTSDMGNATTEQNAPLNYYQQFAQTANTLGGRGGSTTATQGTTSNPIAGALGGAQLGQSLSNWWGGGSSQPISQPNQQAFEDFGAGNGWWGTGG